MNTFSCYIRKNTPYIRHELERLGIYKHPDCNDDALVKSDYLFVNRGMYSDRKFGYIEEIECSIDCGIDEVKFFNTVKAKENIIKSLKKYQ